MKIIITNPKGSAGKTPTSFALYQEFKKLQYITNDVNFGFNIENIIKDKYTYINPEDVKHATKIIEQDDYIFDAGGFTSIVIKKFLENSDYIIIPMPIEKEVILSTLRYINDIKANKKITGKIILIANKFSNSKYLEETLEIVRRMFSDKVDEIAYLRETNILHNLYEENCSMVEYKEKYPLYRRNKIFEEWDNFVQLIEH